MLLAPPTRPVAANDLGQFVLSLVLISWYLLSVFAFYFCLCYRFLLILVPLTLDFYRGRRLTGGWVSANLSYTSIMTWSHGDSFGF
jgi:hypothetical protein